MKVLFFTNILEDYTNREMLGIMYLSACLKKAGHKAETCIVSDAVETVKSFKPDLLAYSVTTGFHNRFLKINLKMKRITNALSIFGGPHTTFFPEMIYEDGVDIICIGEGEEAIVELCGRLEAKRDITDVKNLWVKQDGKVYKNDIRTVSSDLDSIPYPDREGFYNRYKLARNNKIKSIITIRGCPFKCTYCFNHAYNKNYKDKGVGVRFRSIDNVIGELKEIKRYPVDLIHFCTDTFILNKQWIKDFSPIYKKEIGLPFYCLVRANIVTQEVVEYLRYAGCVTVGIGVEMGNERLRNGLLKRDISNQEIIESIRLLKKAGINVLTTNILGLPDGNLETDFETYELNKKCRPAYATYSIFQPYPKTELGDYCIQKGLYNISAEPDTNIYYSSSPLSFPPSYKRQMENFQKLAAITVEFPFLFPLVKQLIKLPPNWFFNLCYKIWKGYCGKKRIFIHRLSLGDYAKAAFHYLFGGVFAEKM